VGCPPGAALSHDSNRSSDNNNKILEIEALILESKTRSNDCLISQLLRSCIGILWGVRSKVFTCPTFLAEPQLTTYLTYLPTYLLPLCDLYIYPLLVFMPFCRGSVTSGHLVRASTGNCHSRVRARSRHQAID
jgi:hypothetical protein